MFYFISLPFIAIAELWNWENKLNALRLVSFLAIPVWLLVLRPAFLGLRPTRWILPFVFMFFWNHIVIRLFGSSYPDPWSWILVLTALELLIRDAPYRYEKSILLICLASMFKEPAVIFLPFVVCAWLWADRREPLQKILLGTASAAPFLLYFAVRNYLGEDIAGINAEQGLRAWRPEWTTDAVVGLGGRYIDQITQNFGLAQVIAFIVAPVIGISIFLREKSFRSELIFLGSCILGIGLFFLLDRSTGPNLRFFFWVMLPAMTLVLLGNHPHFYGEIRRKIIFWIFCLVLALPQGLRLIEDRGSIFAGNPVANFILSKGEPIYLPINQLLSVADKSDIEVGRRYSSAMVDRFVHKTRFSKNGARIEFSERRQLHCSCTDAKPSVASFFILPVNNRQELQNETRSTVQQPRIAFWLWTDLEVSKCWTKMKDTCSQAFQANVRGRTLGMVGYN